jgi:hypothetical protein
VSADQLAQLRQDMDEDFAWTMAHDQMLETRIAALEEVAAARWPRRWLLAARLGRQLRASVRGYSWAGPAWTDKRGQAVSDSMAQYHEHPRGGIR